MTNQKLSDAVGHSCRRVGVLAAATILLSLSGGPAAHADDGGLLGDAVDLVGETGDQVVEPVVQTVESAAPQPVQEVVEPVQQAVEPAVAAAEQVVEETVRVVEPATEPVVRVAKPAPPPAAEPVEDAVAEEAPTPAPAPPRAPAVGGAGTSHPGDGSGPDPAAHVSTAQQVPNDDQHRSDAADGTDFADLAPRAMARPTILLQDPEVEDPVVDEELRSLVNALMQMWAGPGAVDAGLAGREAPDAQMLGPTSGMVPVLLGLLLGTLSLSIRRVLVRHSGDRPHGAAPTEE